MDTPFPSQRSFALPSPSVSLKSSGVCAIPHQLPCGLCSEALLEGLG